MPEITDAEYRQFVRYQGFGTPEELDSRARKVTDLESDNKGQRDEIRTLKEAAKPVPEGGRILSKEDAVALDAYAALGTPEEVQGKVKTAEEATGELATLKRRDQVRSAAAATGYRPEVLENLPNVGGWTFEVKEETARDAAGKETKANVAYVTSGEGKAPVRLADAVEGDAVLKAFLPALKVEPQAGEEGRSMERFPPSPERGDPPRPISPQEIEARKRRHMAYTI